MMNAPTQPFVPGGLSSTKAQEAASKAREEYYAGQVQEDETWKIRGLEERISIMEIFVRDLANKVYDED